MTMMFVGGALVCAWVFLCLLSTERERSTRDAETALKAALADAEKQAQDAARVAAAAAAGHSEKLDVSGGRH